MRVLGILGHLALTVLAVVGVASALVWGATTAGWIQPLVVISGSMEPGIATGDLLVARPVPVEEIEVGQVLSLTSAVTGDIVTHRVVEVVPGPDGSVAVRMRGDANPAADAETYEVSDEVWAPRWQWSGGGHVVRTVTRPQVAVPVLVAVVALIGLTLLPSGRDEGEEPGRDPDGRGADGPADASGSDRGLSTESSS